MLNVPVDTVHVGCVTVPNIGTAGVVDEADTVNGSAFDIQPVVTSFTVTL